MHLHFYDFSLEIVVDFVFRFFDQFTNVLLPKDREKGLLLWYLKQTNIKIEIIL